MKNKSPRIQMFSLVMAHPPKDNYIIGMEKGQAIRKN
jgi:hypothetical protein